MDYLTTISHLLAKHQAELAELAGYEANSKTLKVTLQLNRLRSAEEQTKLLESYYAETLQTLKELDETGSYHLPVINQLVHQSGRSLEELSALARNFGSLAGVTGQATADDFPDITDAPLNAIKQEHPMYDFLHSYKQYIGLELFLSWIKDLLDVLEGHSGKDKVEAQPIDQAKAGNTATIALTTAQKVLALSYLMRWAGIELGERQAARHHRFIAALTGVGPGTVKEKYPSARVEDRPNHLQNLKALIPLFESVAANELVKRVQQEIDFEQQERD